MLDLNFQEVILNKDELKTLKTLRDKAIYIDNKAVEHTLSAYYFIEQTIVDADKYGDLISDGTYMISGRGERYLLYLSKIRKNRIFEWLRYIITTAVAIIALIRTL